MSTNFRYPDSAVTINLTAEQMSQDTVRISVDPPLSPLQRQVDQRERLNLINFSNLISGENRRELNNEERNAAAQGANTTSTTSYGGILGGWTPETTIGFGHANSPVTYGNGPVEGWAGPSVSGSSVSTVHPLSPPLSGEVALPSPMYFDQILRSLFEALSVDTKLESFGSSFQVTTELQLTLSTGEILKLESMSDSIDIEDLQ